MATYHLCGKNKFVLNRDFFFLLFFLQHYLTMLGATLAIPFILSSQMCFADNTLAISEVLSTIFFASGLVTLLQSTFGVRWAKALQILNHKLVL